MNAFKSDPTLSDDIRYGLAIVTDLDTAFIGSPLRARSLASDLEEAMEHASDEAARTGAIDPEVLREIARCGDVVRRYAVIVEGRADDDEGPAPTFADASAALDLAFIRLCSLARNLCGLALHSCMAYEPRITRRSH